MSCGEAAQIGRRPRGWLRLRTEGDGVGVVIHPAQIMENAAVAPSVEAKSGLYFGLKAFPTFEL